jgi:plastocyanin
MISRTVRSRFAPRVAGRWVTLALIVLAGTACRADHAPAETSGRYVPQVRNVTITTVPLLVREQQTVLPFLKEDFARGGVLEGKEVYGFSPSTITVVEGDTIHFTLINPEDDEHSFVLPDLAVSLPGQKVTTATYIAKRSGVFPFVCAIQAHLPMMWGQLVVLSASSMESRT